MNILNKEQSKKILTKLCHKLGYFNNVYIDKYLNSSPIRIRPAFGLDIHSFPLLWYPQPNNPSMKYINEIWEDVLAVTNQVGLNNWLDPINKKLLPVLISESIENTLFGAGNWDIHSNISHKVIEFKKKELNEILKSDINPETFFFPEDLSWVLVITHEDLSFVAGSKEFIDKIKEYFPDHKKYEPEYWREILGISNQDLK